MTVKRSDSKLPLQISPTASVPVVTSVVIHALLLGLLVPGLSQGAGNNNNNDPLAKVSVVELNKAEKTRLPSLSGNEATPNVNKSNTPSQNTAPLNNSLPVLPNTVANSSLPSLPPLPQQQTSYLPPLPSISSLPQTPSLPPIPIDNTTPKAIPEEPSYQRSYPYQQMYPQSTLPSLAPQNYSDRPIPTFEPPRPASNPDDLIRAKTFNQNQNTQPIPIPIENSQPNNNPNQIASSPDNKGGLTPQQEWREKLIAQRIAEIQRRRNSLEEDKSNTTDDEATRNYINWVGKVKSVKPPAISLDGVYPKDACVRQLEGTAILGVVVDESGRISSTVDILKSAGYPILNQQAIAQVQRAGPFNNTTGAPQPYRVSVNFQYNPFACRGYTVPAKPPISEPTNNKPESTRKIAPQPTDNKPESTPEPTNNKPESTRKIAPQPTDNKPESTPEPTNNKPESTRKTEPESIPNKPEVIPDPINKPEALPPQAITKPEAIPQAITKPEALPQPITKPEALPQVTPKPEGQEKPDS